MSALNACAQCAAAARAHGQVEGLNTALEGKTAELAQTQEELQHAHVVIQARGPRALPCACLPQRSSSLQHAPLPLPVQVPSSVSPCARAQERTFLGASLKRAEQALAVHAEALTHELGACARDVAALFVRLDEVRAGQGSACCGACVAWRMHLCFPHTLDTLTHTCSRSHARARTPAGVGAAGL